jgi:hypothetical protein
VGHSIHPFPAIEGGSDQEQVDRIADCQQRLITFTRNLVSVGKVMFFSCGVQ